MKGPDVFKHAVEKLSSALDEALTKAGKTPDEIDWLVPHQANLRIINGMQKKTWSRSTKSCPHCLRTRQHVRCIYSACLEYGSS